MKSQHEEPFEFCSKKEKIADQPLILQNSSILAFDQLSDLWIIEELKHQTHFKVQIEDNQLVLSCNGDFLYKHSSNLTKKKCLLNPIQFSKIKKQTILNTCTFQMNFQILQPKSASWLTYFVTQMNDEAQSQNQKMSLNLKNKHFKLKNNFLLHSQNCAASIQNFIFQRNYRRIDEQKDFFHQLIYQRYNEVGHPEQPNAYFMYLKEKIGYDFLYQGLDSKEQNHLRLKLKKKYDNLVKKARQLYQIPVTQPKINQRRKKPFSIPNKRLNFQDSHQYMEEDEESQFEVLQQMKPQSNEQSRYYISKYKK